MLRGHEYSAPETGNNRCEGDVNVDVDVRVYVAASISGWKTEISLYFQARGKMRLFEDFNKKKTTKKKRCHNVEALHVYVYVCIYVYICVHRGTLVYTHRERHAHTHTHTDIPRNTRASARVHTCTYTLDGCTRTYISAYIVYTGWSV